MDDFLAENYFEDYDEMDEMNDDIVNDDMNGEGSDWIELSGCGKLSKWKFPSCLTTCPILTCSTEFDSRADVIGHFKERHAVDLILCYLCDVNSCLFVLVFFNF